MEEASLYESDGYEHQHNLGLIAMFFPAEGRGVVYWSYPRPRCSLTWTLNVQRFHVAKLPWTHGPTQKAKNGNDERDRREVQIL